MIVSKAVADELDSITEKIFLIGFHGNLMSNFAGCLHEAGLAGQQTGTLFYAGFQIFLSSSSIRASSLSEEAALV